MANELKPKTDLNQPTIYQIRLVGHLGSQWAGWFGDLAITLDDDGDMLLTGLVVDQAALHGLLRKVRNLGLPLRSIMPVESGQEEISNVK